MKKVLLVFALVATYGVSMAMTSSNVVTANNAQVTIVADMDDNSIIAPEGDKEGEKTATTTKTTTTAKTETKSEGCAGAKTEAKGEGCAGAKTEAKKGCGSSCGGAKK